MKTTLVSDVASLYFLMRDLDNRIEVASQTIASRRLYFNMVNERFLKGESAELDKLQAEQQVAVASTLASLGHVLANLLPLYLMCDGRDIDVRCRAGGCGGTAGGDRDGQRHERDCLGTARASSRALAGVRCRRQR